MWENSSCGCSHTLWKILWNFTDFVHVWMGLMLIRLIYKMHSAGVVTQTSSWGLLRIKFKHFLGNPRFTKPKMIRLLTPLQKIDISLCCRHLLYKITISPLCFVLLFFNMPFCDFLFKVYIWSWNFLSKKEKCPIFSSCLGSVLVLTKSFYWFKFQKAPTVRTSRLKSGVFDIHLQDLIISV